MKGVFHEDLVSLREQDKAEFLFASVSTNGLRLPSPSFADDISLLALHPSFLQTFMNICFDYGV